MKNIWIDRKTMIKDLVSSSSKHRKSRHRCGMAYRTGLHLRGKSHLPIPHPENPNLDRNWPLADVARWTGRSEATIRRRASCGIPAGMLRPCQRHAYGSIALLFNDYALAKLWHGFRIDKRDGYLVLPNNFAYHPNELQCCNFLERCYWTGRRQQQMQNELESLRMEVLRLRELMAYAAC
jgi:hypothetical protein